jgi:hypothetical protein
MSDSSSRILAFEHTDNSTAQSDITAEVYITSNSQMVKLDNLGNLLESLLELLDLIEKLQRAQARYIES